ncbi:hypothetical protein [Pseudomonas alkylphenolica]|nr:hypothetical protein [Pseudomonas alkylphenolica]
MAKWVISETPRELYLEDPTEGLKDYINDMESSDALGVHSEHLATWHLAMYEQMALNSIHEFSELSLASTYYGYMLKFESAFVTGGSNSPIVPSTAALALSLAAIANWPVEFKARFDIILNGLDTALLDLKHRQSGKLFHHFWFILQLYAKSVNRKIDVFQYARPETPSPYEQVLEQWDTPDQSLLDALVSQMADFHLFNAATPMHDEIFEFDYEDRMLFPYEVLTLLRTREWHSLKNPTAFEHPLMQHPLSKLPLQLTEPETTLLDEVVRKFNLEQFHISS